MPPVKFQALTDEDGGSSAADSENGGATAPHSKISTLTKVTYGFGATPASIANVVQSFLFPSFLLFSGKVSPDQASLILLIGRVWDACIDPVIGHLISRTNTRWGALKPWIALSTIPWMLLYFVLWIVPDANNEGRTAYYLCIYLAMQSALSCYYIPFTTMTMELSSDSAERDSATSYRIGFEMLAVLIATIPLGIVTSTFDETCTPCNATNSSSPSSDVTIGGFEPYHLSAGIVAFFILVGGATVTFGVKIAKDLKTVLDRPQSPTSSANSLTAAETGTPEVTSTAHMSFLDGFRITFSSRPFNILVLCLLWCWLAGAAVQAVYVFWITEVLDRADQLEYISTALLVSTVVGVPVSQFLVNRFGKRKCLLFSLWLSIPNNLATYLMTSSTPLWVIYAVMATGVFGTMSYVVPWQMLPDIIDECEAKTGARHDARFYAVFVFLQKFATGVGSALATMVLGRVGFISNPCCTQSQPESAITGIRWAAGMIPCLFSIPAVLVFWLAGPSDKR